MKRVLLYAFILLIMPFAGKTQTFYIENGTTVYINRGATSGTVLQVTGAIQNLGTLTDNGQIQATQDFTSSGAVNVLLGGTTMGTNYDQIVIAGTATLSGTLNVTLSNGYAPVSGASFTILDAASLSGTFTSTNLPTLSSGLSWTTSYNGSAGTVILAVTSVLPVELLTFKATPITNNQIPITNPQILLDWSTDLEQNTAAFTLERSRNGQDFTPLSTTKAKGSKSEYSHIDDAPFNGVNYYRLKINDLDGKSAYSKVVSAIIGGSTFKIKVYPSVVLDAVNISTDGGDMTAVNVVNTAGQIVLSKTKAALNGNLITLDLSALAAGIYIVRAQNTEGVVASSKIVKQH